MVVIVNINWFVLHVILSAFQVFTWMFVDIYKTKKLDKKTCYKTECFLLIVIGRELNCPILSCVRVFDWLVVFLFCYFRAKVEMPLHQTVTAVYKNKEKE